MKIVIKYELRCTYTARVSRVIRNGRRDSRPTNKSCTSTSDNNIDIALEDTRLNPRVSRDFAGFRAATFNLRPAKVDAAHFFPNIPSIIISAFRRFSLANRVGLTGRVRPGERKTTVYRYMAAGMGRKRSYECTRTRPAGCARSIFERI